MYSLVVPVLFSWTVLFVYSKHYRSPLFMKSIFSRIFFVQWTDFLVAYSLYTIKQILSETELHTIDIRCWSHHIYGKDTTKIRPDLDMHTVLCIPARERRKRNAMNTVVKHRPGLRWHTVRIRTVLGRLRPSCCSICAVYSRLRPVKPIRI